MAGIFGIATLLWSRARGIVGVPSAPVGTASTAPSPGAFYVAPENLGVDMSRRRWIGGVLALTATTLLPSHANPQPQESPLPHSPTSHDPLAGIPSHTTTAS